MTSPKDESKPMALKGISDKQIEYHFETYYEGYINKLNEVLEKLKIVDRARATDCGIRDLSKKPPKGIAVVTR